MFARRSALVVFGFGLVGMFPLLVVAQTQPAETTPVIPVPDFSKVPAAVSLPNFVALAEEQGDQREGVEKATTEMQALKSIIKRQDETITQLKQKNEDLAKKVQELQTALDKAKAQARAWKTVKSA